MKLLYNSKTLLFSLLFVSALSAKAAGDGMIAKTDSGTVNKTPKKRSRTKGGARYRVETG